MKKRYLTYAVLLLLIVFTIYYFYPMSISEITESYTGFFTPDEIKVSVHFSYLSRKDFKMNDEKLIDELFVLLESIKVRRVLVNPTCYSPKLMNTYWIMIHSMEGKYLWLYIKDKNYISINGETYKILGKVDLRRIYELVLLDQDKDSINEFYFNLIEQK
ncbi:hypothetical protein [Crassaminicella profunda]|uniref:hypothetical protein n=1 Tax=Crassaminicella profunda TaxID=1286698 RepID=UPI001CA60D07|nr:hypothetical protein [Crassaminicella profunda]QZY57061.1 hypothetical protein K7H06_09135 [Crassaminicella profunda]